MQLADNKRMNFLLKSLLILSPLAVMGCAPTTPNFDKNFGRALQEAKESQKFTSEEPRNEVHSWSPEFSAVINSYLGGRQPSEMSGSSQK
jgi:hypothetical protein